MKITSPLFDGFASVIVKLAVSNGTLFIYQNTMTGVISKAKIRIYFSILQIRKKQTTLFVGQDLTQPTSIKTKGYEKSYAVIHY